MLVYQKTMFDRYYCIKSFCDTVFYAIILIFTVCTRHLIPDAGYWHGYVKSCLEKVKVNDTFVFNVPPTAKAIWRHGQVF